MRSRATNTTVAMAAILLAALVTGCGSLQAGSGGGAGQTKPHRTASPRNVRQPAGPADLSCPLKDLRSGIDQYRGQPIPAGFTPVAVIECTFTNVNVAGRGEWTALAKRIAVTGFGPLMSALRMPSERAGKNIACVSETLFVPQFVLVGKDGDVIYPKIPKTACGQPTPRVMASLDALKFRTISAKPQRQVLTQSEVVSGCAAAWKDMLGFDTQQHGGMTPSAGGPLFRPMPKSVRVCIYRWAPDSLDTRFVRGGSISGATEGKLLKGLTAGRSSVGCAISHRAFAVIQPAGPESSNVAWVELGGCDRLLRGNYSVGQATRAAIAIIGNVGRS